MRIIIGTTDAPPDPCGMPYQRWVYLLAKGLAERDHRVSFWCVEFRPGQEDAARRALASLPIDLHVFKPPVRQPSGGSGAVQMMWPVPGSSANSLPGFAAAVAT